MHALIKKATDEKRNLLEHECLALLAEYGLPVPHHCLIKSADEAAEAAKAIGYPAALKIVSKDILHKSDVGGVRVSIMSETELRRSYEEIRISVKKNAPDAMVEGMLLVESARSGVECIVGLLRDRQLGSALMFGSGGIMVELFDDVSLCMLPVSEVEAIEMIRSTKAYKLLTGYRGKEVCDLRAIADVLIKVGRMAEENPEIAEIDINPLFAYPEGVMPVDARIIL